MREATASSRSDDAAAPRPSGGRASPRRRLIVATLNPAKARELHALLAGVPFEIVPLADLEGAALPSEGEHSYVENARAKAIAAARFTGAVALADDSGLEVDALDGAPGVTSARFGGPELTDEQRCRHLLERLASVPAPRRTARYRCVIVLADSHRQEVVEACVDGTITDSPRGSHGFGYDPVFFYPPLGRTFAELASDTKQRVSHRGLAVARAADLLRLW